MTYKIGFLADHESGSEQLAPPTQSAPSEPRRSLVSIYFPQRGMNLTYYNDKFDLHVGDLVYVDGKLEGMRGRVTEVNYTFKIKLSDYKRVIALVDTEVHGEFLSVGSYFVTFDPGALAKDKVRLWYLSPDSADAEYVSGSDEGDFFVLNSLDGDDAFSVFRKIGSSPAVAERGYDYYDDDRVRYICLERGRGYAIVQGSEAYEVEFSYDGNWNISGLTCSCYCSRGCKHEVAAILRLYHTLCDIVPEFLCEGERLEHFAAIVNTDLFSNAVVGKGNGHFTL